MRPATAMAMFLIAALATILSPREAAALNCRSDPAPEMDWTDCNKAAIMLGGSDLSKAVLFNVDFSGTDLRDSRLQGANFEKATLIRAALSGSDATGANFSRVEAYRTSFAKMIAKGANFGSAELERADFSGADLEGANFNKSELGRAVFDDALLTGTSFQFANLSRVELSKARYAGPIDFTGAFLYLTRIEGIDLSAAKGLTQAQIDQACGNEDTVLPPGLTMPAAWPCKFQND
jgi:uncharacterized protein YjbI with pentapeptide repeats